MNHLSLPQRKEHLTCFFVVSSLVHKRTSAQTIYEGAVVPILMYGAPIWVEAIRKNRNLLKYKRIQRLINIKIAKA
jgi:hypothetical protein